MCRGLYRYSLCWAPMATTTKNLIGYGLAPAIAAADLAIGDVTLWNYGIQEHVIAIAPKGAHSLSVTMRYPMTGREVVRTLRRTTIVAIYN